MTKKKRGPLSYQVESKAEEIAIREMTHHSWREAIQKGILLGVSVYFIQLIIILIFLVSGSDLVSLIAVLTTLLFLELAFFFLLASIAIFLDPSPSWHGFKSALMNRPLSVKTTTEALRTGGTRASTAIVLFIFLEIQGIFYRIYY